MARSVYVATSDPNSGKTVVALGAMEAASRRAERVAFFRPVVRESPEADPSLRLMRARYRLPFPAESLYGANRETVRRLLAEDRTDDLIKLVLEKYKAVEEQADLVVCEGTSFAGLAPAYEFNLNADLAANLGAAVVQVVTARGKSDADVLDAVRIALDQLADRGCDVLAAAVNHAPPDRLDALRSRLRGEVGGTPVYVLPADPVLDRPTVGEIAEALGAARLAGSDPGLETEVRGYLVAAMTLPNFLDRLREGYLIVTPGDRADILVGSLASVAAHTLPNVAGLVLTGGLTPPPQVMRLVGGLSPVPILGVTADTFETATAVAGVPAALRPENERKIASALGLFEAHVDLAELESRIAATKPTRVTPLMFEYELIRQAKADRRHVVLPEGAEPRVLRAADILLRRGVVDLTLLGDEGQVRRAAASLGVNLDGVPVIDPAASPWLDDFVKTYVELRKAKAVNEAV
ncbi:MAG TPA: phosphate acyltransferase, partial [Planctomycetaceae bacterium]